MCTHLRNKRCFHVKSAAYYFYMKTNILADFHTCICVPLMENYIFCVVTGFRGLARIPDLSILDVSGGPSCPCEIVNKKQKIQSKF